MASWGPDLVTFGHDLLIKGGVWAALKCLIALDQVLITLREGGIYYLGFCLLVLVNLRYIIVT